MQPDKQKHLLAGFLISLGAFLLSPLWAFTLLIVAAVGKELYDLTGRGTPEWADIIYTVAGGLPVILGVTIC